MIGAGYPGCTERKGVKIEFSRREEDKDGAGDEEGDGDGVFGGGKLGVLLRSCGVCGWLRSGHADRGWCLKS